MIVDGSKKRNLDKAVELIWAGDVVGFPTETVYGLGADASNLKGVEKIFKVKGRPFEDPLILHVGDRGQLGDVVEKIPSSAVKLINRFWPGPLTLVLRKKAHVSSRVTAGLDTVAVRMPRHLVALALIKNSKCVIAAPSANMFQRLSPTTATAVSRELGSRVPLILDGGPCSVGLESTVLSLVDEPRILRPGGVCLEDIESELGQAVKVNLPTPGKKTPLESPGMGEFHYAPRKPLAFFDQEALKAYVKKRSAQKILTSSALVCFSADDERAFGKEGFKNIFVLSTRGNCEEASKNLFSLLRKLDDGVWLKIFALKCPDERLGKALNDRLKKAQHTS